MEVVPALPTDASSGEPSGRREREREARRRAMLTAALGVFGEKGFEGATLDEIAEQAEFGKGTLYNYFPGGKDELYLTLFEEVVLGGLMSVVQTSFPDLAALTTPAAVRDAFCGFVEGLIGHFHTHRGQFLLFMKDGHRMMLDPARASFFVTRFERVIDAVEAPISAAIAAGALRPLPARSVAHLLMGNVRGHLMATTEDSCVPAGLIAASPFQSPAEAASFITTVLFDGLLAQPSAPADPS